MASSNATTPNATPAGSPTTATPNVLPATKTGKFTGLGIEPLQTFSVSQKQPRVYLKTTNGSNYLPGQPRIRLHGTASGGNQSTDEVVDYLRDSHLTNELDELLPFMSYIFVQTPSYRHIMPLHHQGAHARDIIVDEAPGLHLVWYYDRIFIKPIPAYFYSSEFWTYLHSHSDPSKQDQRKENDVYAAAVGFMRSYYFLIKYKIDFVQACQLKLIPKVPGTDKHPTYEEFCRFIEQFNDITDIDTCRRYHYGELRLTRINRTSLLRKGRLAYFHIYPQWGSYLRHFLAPIVMVLGGCSIVLNAMQVTLNAQEMLGDPTQGSGLSQRWIYFTRASLYFPVVIIITIAVILVLSLVGVSVMAANDLLWAKTTRRKKRNGEPDAGNRSHGLIW
ncbi:hypothetical protein jhhlp_004980 [Lomentospora prolificans]|uniref:Uncharacterized protein n=1 Tax=Lomentospora prolificans TaxID=41688 RepID=A0A2N3N876_9PEZI|nr:hypothetical protein jhhlp_004980 [Lomentospora prolificans]